MHPVHRLLLLLIPCIQAEVTTSAVKSCRRGGFGRSKTGHRHNRFLAAFAIAPNTSCRSRLLLPVLLPAAAAAAAAEVPNTIMSLNHRRKNGDVNIPFPSRGGGGGGGRGTSSSALSNSLTSIFDSTPALYSWTTFAACNAIGLIITLFFPKFHYHVDFLGTGAFCVAALVPLVLYPQLQSVTRITWSAAAVTIWSIKLASFLLYRVVYLGKDGRFDSLFATPSSAAAFWMVSTLWGICCSLPHALGFTTMAAGNAMWVRFGAALYTVGLSMETLADYQKWMFKLSTSANAATGISSASIPFCNVGLWSISQHPNWMGNLLLWTGIFIMNASALIEPSPKMAGAAAAAATKTNALVDGIIRPLWRRRRLLLALLGPLFMVTLFTAQATGTIMADSLHETHTRYGYGTAMNADYTKYIDTTPLIVPHVFNPFLLACMTVLNRPVATNETPLSHQLGNIIGLALLEKLGLSMGVGEFSFQTKFDYFWSDTPTKALFLDST